jgi:two-component system, chemotaxis family, protein-glutamate methylesterase/glutaminase
LGVLPWLDGAPGTSARTPQVAFDVVAIAASLGGPEAVRKIVGGLPPWFPAAVLVVQHRTPAAQHITINLLRRCTDLRVELAQTGDQPTQGIVHVLPADRQLIVGPDGQFANCSGVEQPGHSADPVFTSVAKRFGSRALGVVLSGANDDGATGVVALKRAGGRVLAQNRATARCFTMPAAAIATGCVDLVLPIERIAHALVSLTAWPGAASLLRVPMAPWAVLD